MVACHSSCQINLTCGGSRHDYRGGGGNISAIYIQCAAIKASINTSHLLRGSTCGCVWRTVTLILVTHERKIGQKKLVTLSHEMSVLTHLILLQ